MISLGALTVSILSLMTNLALQSQAREREIANLASAERRFRVETDENLRRARAPAMHTYSAFLEKLDNVLRAVSSDKNGVAMVIEAWRRPDLLENGPEIERQKKLLASFIALLQKDNDRLASLNDGLWKLIERNAEYTPRSLREKLNILASSTSDYEQSCVNLAVKATQLSKAIRPLKVGMRPSRFWEHFTEEWQSESTKYNVDECQSAISEIELEIAGLRAAQ